MNEPTLTPPSVGAPLVLGLSPIAATLAVTLVVVRYLAPFVRSVLA